MSNHNLTLKPITELLDDDFHIPAYQRGYRWTTRQVKDLLDDISSFQIESDGKKKETFYCLQPIVVARRDDGQWELVDGQQRLTTLFLILTYLKPLVEVLGKSPYSLEYETRKNSATFLEHVDLARAEENIDYYHICEAYKTIKKWFEDKDGTRKLLLLQCILNSDDDGRNVKVIWYELPDDQPPVDAFVRLNMGKIPLTNAELIRALFLKSRNFEENEIHLKQLQIAQEWDAIEKAMQNDGFWYFLYGGKTAYPTRIEYLFELITADIDMSDLLEDDPYRTFIAYSRGFQETAALPDGMRDQHITRVAAEWRKVKQYFMTCEEWFRDRTLYHLVGYLITHGVSLCDIRVMSLACGKSSFQQKLKHQMFVDMFDCDPVDYVDETDRQQMISEALGEFNYANDRAKVRSVLLLFNISTLLENCGSELRFPFDSYKKEEWDIEHIRSVKSDKPGRVDAQRQWLQAVVAFLTGTDDPELQPEVPCEEGELRDRIIKVLSKPFGATTFDELYEDVLGKYGESDSGDVDHGIQNLALLDAGTNRGYKNAIFPIKRRHILALDKAGTFAPLCTTNVFLKYYSTKLGNMMSWTKTDREDYFNAMVGTLTIFFAPEPRSAQ